MKLDLSPYRGKIVCVALSGGKDSVALLHYLWVNAEKYGIFLCALNCDHGIRGKESVRDSEFVKNYCNQLSVPLIFYRHEGETFRSEESARLWRMKCFSDGSRQRTLSDGTLWRGYEFLATAHHANDNAETVLFNLARGSGVYGVCGMDRSKKIAMRGEEGKFYTLVKPLLDCTREEIDEYIAKNALPFVTDSSNLTDDYTRNKLRHKVIPALEECVPGAVKAIGRFSRLAREDEEYFSRRVDKILKKQGDGYLFTPCAERVIFKRAVVRVLREEGIKDYTSLHLDALFSLQSADLGKKFEFLGMVALKERDGVILYRGFTTEKKPLAAPFESFLQGRTEYGGKTFFIVSAGGEIPYLENVKILRLDKSKIPQGAVVRFFESGDKFRKFGGGTKNLSDFFTDKKIPLRLRGGIPLLAEGNTVYAAGGLEISEDVKITEETAAEDKIFLLCADVSKEY